MALYTFNFLKPLKSLRHGLFSSVISRGAENYITTLRDKAFLVGVVKVRILGVPFKIILQPEHFRLLAKGFYSRADALAYAVRQKKKGIKQGSFDWEKADSEQSSTNSVSTK